MPNSINGDNYQKAVIITVISSFQQKYQNDCYFHGSKGIFAVETLDETDIRLLQCCSPMPATSGTFSVLNLFFLPSMNICRLEKMGIIKSYISLLDRENWALIW
jgi:hypothetical protein